MTAPENPAATLLLAGSGTPGSASAETVLLGLPLVRRTALAASRAGFTRVYVLGEPPAPFLRYYEVLRRAQEVASAFGLPVMIHMGQTISSLAKLFPLLKRGDIVTHMFAPPPNSIVDDRGRILPEVLAARKRGVWFDVGNGQTGHLRWDIVERVMKAGFWPDTFSTDWNVNSPKTGVIDFPNCMSKFLELGMTLDQVIARATLNPSRVFPLFNDRGTLNVGAPADVAILELREGTFEFLDNYKNTITGRQRLFPSGTVLAGKRVARS